MEKETYKCLNCGKEFIPKSAIDKKAVTENRFCSRECSMHYSGNKSHPRNEKQKEKVRRSIRINNLKKKGFINDLMTEKEIDDVIKQHYTNDNKSLHKYEAKCVICGKSFTVNSTSRHIRKTCSEECRQKSLVEPGRINGLLSAEAQQRRSKNEILMAELCEEHYGKDKVLCNESMFNGWDADIVIPELKVAILWNGIWHYKQISKQQSLLQVQSRDKIKIEQIEKAGFIPYIIKDMGSHSKKFVLSEFNKFIEKFPKIS